MSAKYGEMVGGTTPMYVSFFTPDYAPYAERLTESLDRANINLSDRCIRAMKSDGSWVLNCAKKGQFLWDCLEEFQRPLVWLDADALLKKYTGHFSILIAQGYDVAAHLPDRRRHPLCNSNLCSGTLFFNNTRNAQDVLMDWIVACTESKHELDQEVLYKVLFEREYAQAREGQTRFANLPAELCTVADLMSDIESPVIFHTQASRVMKDRIIPERDPDEGKPLKLVANQPPNKPLPKIVAAMQLKHQLKTVKRPAYTLPTSPPTRQASGC